MQWALTVCTHTHSGDLSQSFKEVRAATSRQGRDWSWLCWGPSCRRVIQPPGQPPSRPLGIHPIHLYWENIRIIECLPVPALEEEHRREERQPHWPHSLCFQLMSLSPPQVSAGGCHPVSAAALCLKPTWASPPLTWAVAVLLPVLLFFPEGSGSFPCAPAGRSA